MTLGYVISWYLGRVIECWIDAKKKSASITAHNFSSEDLSKCNYEEARQKLEEFLISDRIATLVAKKHKKIILRKNFVYNEMFGQNICTFL